MPLGVKGFHLPLAEFAEYVTRITLADSLVWGHREDAKELRSHFSMSTATYVLIGLVA